MPQTALCGLCYCCAPSIGEETEAQRGDITCTECKWINSKFPPDPLRA